MTKSHIEDSFECPKCGRLNAGFARCQTSGCGELRREFHGREAVVVEQIGPCVMSGAKTDVRLPNGDYLWAPYFLQYVEKGFLDERYHYTEAYFRIYPYARGRDKGVA